MRHHSGRVRDAHRRARPCLGHVGPAGRFKFNTSTGVGTVKGGSATVSVATIDLTFKATAHQAGNCSSGSETIYTGTLTGEAELVTGLTGGGTVGGKSAKLTGGSPKKSSSPCSYAGKKYTITSTTTEPRTTPARRARRSPRIPR